MKTRKRRHGSPAQIHDIHGYKVVLIPLKVDSLHVACAINNGFINENKDTTGINHLLEHVLSESWKSCKNNCYRFMNDRGLVMNASTDLTIMKYFTTGLPMDTSVMINYIIDIMETPIFSSKKIEREKKSVISELLTVSNDPNTSLFDFFNKHFYAVEGMQYAEDVDRQIKVLSSIDLHQLKNVFVKYYNPYNMLFVVCGKFNQKQVLDVFSRKLIPYQDHVKVEHDCFTKIHDLLFLKTKSVDMPKIMIGFPSMIEPSSPVFVLIPFVVQIIKKILFEVLRTKHDLVYQIYCRCDRTICGTVVFIDANVLQANIKPVLKLIVNVLKEFKHNLIPERFLTAEKKMEKLNFNNKNNSPPVISDSVIEQMMQQIHMKNQVIYSQEEIQTKIQALTLTTFKEIMNLICDFNACFIVYQSNAPVSVSLSDLF